MVLREPRTCAERLLEHRRDEPLRERDERVPRLGVVRAGADDDRGRDGVGEERGELVDRRGIRAAERTTRPAAASSRSSSTGAAQSSIGTITSAGPLRVAASCHARSTAPGTSCARTGWSTQTG